MGGKTTTFLVAAASTLLPVAGAPATGDPGYAEPTGIVDCLLPGPHRRVGGGSYQMPGRPIRTIASECRIRGGDYLLFDRANYDTSLQHWITEAERGDKNAPEAMLYVGEIYEKGLGREPDFAKAAHWYQRAAEAGNTTAMISLAHLYKTGSGVELDLVRAQALYSQAFGTNIPIPLDPTSVKGADQRIETLIAEVDEVRRQKVAVQLELEAANEQLDAARAALDNAMAANGGDADLIGELKQKIREQQSEIDGYNRRIAAMEVQGDELRALRHQLENDQLETERLKELLSLAEADVAASRKSVATHEQALKDKEAEFSERLATMQSEQDREQLQASSRELAVQREKIAGLEAALQEAEEQKALFQALASDTTTNAERIATLNARIAILGQKANSREAEFEAMQEKLRQTERELDVQVAEGREASDASDTEIAERDAEIKRLHAAVERAEQETLRHRSDIDRLTVLSSELETLRSNLEREQAQSNRLQELLTESQDQFADTSRRLVAATKARTDLEQDVENLQQQLAAGDASAQALLDQRARDLQETEQEVDVLRLQVERLEAELRSYDNKVADTAERQRDAIRELKDALAESRAHGTHLAQRLESANAQFAQAQADLERQHDRYEQLQDELLEARAAHQADESELTRKQQELDAERSHVERLQAEVARLTEESRRYETKLDELQAVAQAKQVEFAGPTIVMLEPNEEFLQAQAPLTRGGSSQMTRGISVVAATTVTETRLIRGRVDAPAGLAELTIDGWAVPFDDHNAFSRTLKLDAESKHIRIEAIDHNGKVDVVQFEYRVGGEVFSKDDRFPHERNDALDGLNYYALLIANEDYVHDTTFPDLRTPVADVEAIGHVLEQRYGFEVKILRNADLRTMKSEFTRIFYHEPSDSDPDNDKDAILIYYAGHGHVSDARLNNAYFWAPVDAAYNDPDSWYETLAIEKYMATTSTPQIMVVADSCFAGKVLSRDGQGVSPVDENSRMFRDFLKEYTQNKRSRFVLTSGGMSPVLDGGGGDHSVFARSFLEMLQFNDGIISADNMHRNVAPRVMDLAKKQSFVQQPEFGYLRSAGHESGVFYLPAPLYPANLSAGSL